MKRPSNEPIYYLNNIGQLITLLSAQKKTSFSSVVTHYSRDKTLFSTHIWRDMSLYSLPWTRYVSIVFGATDAILENHKCDS